MPIQAICTANQSEPVGGQSRGGRNRDYAKAGKPYVQLAKFAIKGKRAACSAARQVHRAGSFQHEDAAPRAALFEAMRPALLLDTHALLWWRRDACLGANTKKANRRSGNAVYVSAASIDLDQTGAGQLALPEDIFAIIEAEDFLSLPMDAFHCQPWAVAAIIRILSIAC